MDRLIWNVKLIAVLASCLGASFQTHAQSLEDLQDRDPPHVGRYYHLSVPRRPALSQVDQARVKRLLARFGDVDISPPKTLVARLSSVELRALTHLLRASEVMNDMYLLQQDPGVPDFVAQARQSNNPDLVRFVDHTLSYALPHGGSPQAPDADSIIPGLSPTDGGNMYPSGFTKESLTAAITLQERRSLWGWKIFSWLKWGQKEIDRLRNDRQSLVRMRRSGHLVTVPYRVAFRKHLTFAAAELREAASLLRSQWPKFSAYLDAKAKAFETNQYAESDRLWMLSEPDCPFDIVIGPTESYQDKLLGIREQANAFVILTDPELRTRYQAVMALAQRMDDLLPIPNRDQVGKKTYHVHLLMGYEIYRAGDGRTGIQAIAYNLPNNAEVRNREGFKMTLLKNVMDAKVENGSEEKVQNRLGSWYHAIEELKADITGTFLALEMMEQKNLERALPLDRQSFWVTYVVGLFRAVRFGVEDSHAESNMIQLHHAIRTGGLLYDETTQRFHIDFDKLEAGVRSLTTTVLAIEANPHPSLIQVQAMAKAFLDANQSKVIPKFIQDRFDEAKAAGVPDDLRSHHPMAETFLKTPLTHLFTGLPLRRWCANAAAAL